MFRDDDPGPGRAARPSPWASPRPTKRCPTAGPGSSWRRCSRCTAGAPREHPGEMTPFPHWVLVKVDDSDRRALEQDERFFYPAYLGPLGLAGVGPHRRQGRLGRGARAGRRVIPDRRPEEIDQATRRSRLSPPWFDRRAMSFASPFPQVQIPDNQRLRLPVRRPRRCGRRPDRVGRREVRRRDDLRRDARPASTRSPGRSRTRHRRRRRRRSARPQQFGVRHRVPRHSAGRRHRHHHQRPVHRQGRRQAVDRLEGQRLSSPSARCAPRPSRAPPPSGSPMPR